ncbi:Related to phenylacetyl-CoA ligase,possible benzoylacetate-CoA ligase [Aromatoleum aromaticum EbN1]|uniref:Related to phenylacetyl-CoA ligase,possible benzoylacetate-CoA ligase n=1 Tax=Aromatoleum aromaticum (strain DSM 19018 / LMG 30748 / EbN1) TaxID=76114 RepID=Q5P5G7_AROAE|nr:benzoylacetate-CoA ligase Bal [Aromatoleum aromaticum]CAI07445.1 Related to phenylacetyl-CoA ligase,possible benzoylacetate-CoA ligase [Aromatoleum aromaticum EbN1]
MLNELATQHSDDTRGRKREYWNEVLETMPWREVERWQAQRIDQMLAPLRQRSDLYWELHADVDLEREIRSLADLSDLPFTMKDHIRDAQDRASESEPFGANQSVALADIVQTVSSSGTTGRPLYYALTASDVEVWTDAIANNFFTAGVRKSDVVAHLVGLPMVAGGLPYADAFRRIGATLCWLGGFPTERILREMRRLRTSALLATTSFGIYLTEQWDAVGRETGVPSALRTVLCGGEPGLNQPEIRERITRGLGISQLREVMGLGDVISAMWGECEEHDGMHFNAQKHVAVELIDPQTGATVPWEAGATGELVYTTFARDATPLVRYRSRDHALVIGTDCRCGRTSPRIRCIGRTDDMLIYKGMNVFPTAIRDLITQRFAEDVGPMVRIWKERADQVRFDDPIAVDVEASPRLDASAYAGLATAIAQAVRAQLQVRIEAKVLEPGSLPRSAYKNSLLAVRGSS